MLRNITATSLTVLIFFIILFVYTKLAGPIPFSISSITTNKTDTFNVTGLGKVSIKPDMATIHLGVQANGPTVKVVQDQMNTSINKVIDVLKNNGLDSNDIKTENYNVNPIYDYKDGNQKITGYSANTNLAVKIRDLTKANSLIDAATSAGANQVGGLNFEELDQTQAEDEARQKAIDDAKKKAERISKMAGFSLGKIINYSENNNEFPPRPLSIRSLDAAGGPSPTQLEPGTNEVTVSVTLSYEVK